MKYNLNLNLCQCRRFKFFHSNGDGWNTKIALKMHHYTQHLSYRIVYLINGPYWICWGVLSNL